MRATYQIITPSAAKTLLDLSEFRNRSLKSDVIRRYANDMRHGRWKENGESIVLDKTGCVIDGQHRLSAIMASGVSIGMIIVQGVDRSVFDTIDIGKNRSAADTLQVLEKKNVRTLAAVLRLLDSVDRHGTIVLSRKAGSEPDYSFDVQHALSRFPNAEHSAKYCHSHSSQHIFTPLSLIGAFHYLFGEKDSELRDKFFDALLQKRYESDGCPVRALANAYGNSKSENLMKSNRAIRSAYWIKAWNALRTGKKQYVLRFAPEHHDFPEII